MNKAKTAKLERAGWKLGTPKEFLAITYLSNHNRPFEAAEFPTVDTICEMWYRLKLR